MIKISVIIPVYNVESYLEQCLDSICGQTLQEIEIICVDDGSTDRSSDILRSYAKKDERIRVLTQKNQYAGVARNHGMEYASGQYMLFLDADDFFEIDMLEKMYQRASADVLDIVICRHAKYSDIYHKRIDVEFSDSDAYFPKEKRIFSGKEIKYAGVFQAVKGWAWDKLFRKSFVDECGYLFPDFRSSEDGFFVFMLMVRAKRIGVMEECFVHHRIHNGGSLSNTRDSDWENGFKMLELIKDELENLGVYQCFEQSFVSNAIEFQMWYLLTLTEKDAFLKSYYHIRDVMEPKFRLMQYMGKYLCGKDQVMVYERVLAYDPEQFLLMAWNDRDDYFSGSIRKGWIFPYHLIPKDSRVIIYGAGVVGRDYYTQLSYTGYCRNVYLVDSNYKRLEIHNMCVENPAIIKDVEFDYILVAVRGLQVQQEIREWLLSQGVDEGRIKYCNGR